MRATYQTLMDGATKKLPPIWAVFRFQTALPRAHTHSAESRAFVSLGLVSEDRAGVMNGHSKSWIVDRRDGRRADHRGSHSWCSFLFS